MTNDQQEETNLPKGRSFTEVIGSYFEEPRSDDEKTFAELLNEFDTQKKGELRVGDKITGLIISIGMDTVFVDTGSKIDGAVEKIELMAEDKTFPYQVGDTLDLYVVSANESEIKLSRALSGAGGLELLREAHQNAIPIEGKVKETCKGGFVIDVMKRRAFCPISQIDSKFVETPENYLGASFEFLITRIEEGGKNIIVSRRELLMREQEAARKKFIQTIQPGAVIDGKITRVASFGAFVELSPGVEGMLHISEMSWSRVDKAEVLFKPGDPVRVKLMGLEQDQKSGQFKISLSIKELTGDPWENEATKFQPGDKLRGKVVRCAPFGAFVEIIPGIEGLVHISEMSYRRRVNKPEDIVTVGEGVDVMIKDIDLNNRRISLSIRDAEGDPWLEAVTKYKVGAAVQGLIEKKEKFGYFISLEPGVTGLLPLSKARESSGSAGAKNLKEGETITVMIDSVNPADRKISLTLGNVRDEDNWKQYAKPTDSPLGTLGEKLRQAINRKENPNQRT